LAVGWSGDSELVAGVLLHSRVGVDPIAGTLSWPGGIDLDPDVLHTDVPAASHQAPRLVREYRVQRTT
jgi:hypothetical protein